MKAPTICKMGKTSSTISNCNNELLLINGRNYKYLMYIIHISACINSFHAILYIQSMIYMYLTWPIIRMFNSYISPQHNIALSQLSLNNCARRTFSYIISFSLYRDAASVMTQRISLHGDFPLPLVTWLNCVITTLSISTVSCCYYSSK